MGGSKSAIYEQSARLSNAEDAIKQLEHAVAELRKLYYRILAEDEYIEIEPTIASTRRPLSIKRTRQS